MTTKTKAMPGSATSPPEPPDQHPCDVCPTRSLAEDSSFGYCEGCPSRLRKCRSCEQFKPQVDWGWGFKFGGLVRWVCADCHVRPISDRVADHPQFVARLSLDERNATWVVHELERAADLNQHHPVAEALRRMARSLEADGNIDIDVSDFNLADRKALLVVIERLQESVPSPAYGAAYSLRRAWITFVMDSSEPQPGPKPQPTVAERVAAMGLEREA